MNVFNLNGDEWDATEEHAGYAFKDAWVGGRLGSQLIGGSLYEVPAGKKLWPYHLHHANEEWAIVLRGTPTLRTPEGERELAEGDVVCHPCGKDGFHQVRNATDEPIRVLMLSTLLAPDIVEYGDSNKISALDGRGERLFRAFRGADAEYWEGE